MQLQSVRIANFRCIQEAIFSLNTATVFVGGNGSGKSTVLRALDVFYTINPGITVDDYYNGNTANSIEIELTFYNFSASERTLFASKIDADRMSVTRVFENGPRNARYFGSTLLHEPFSTIRSLGGVQKRTTYNDFARDNPNYNLLPARVVGEVDGRLADWEALHPDQCERRRDDGQWFGFTNNANGKLQRATNFVFVPAIRDAAAESGSGRTAAASRLMDLVVRSAIASREEVRAFRQRISDEYRALMNPANLPELQGLAGALSGTLQQFYSSASVALQWQAIDDISAPPPMASVSLEEDRYRSPVDRTGHGLQRAFVFALLQHLALATSLRANESDEHPSDEPSERSVPGLILAIEEPELYQHPSKQRHFARVLGQLAAGTIPGVASQTQVLFATHSPHFIAMDEFHSIRLVRRVPSETGGPRVSQICASTMLDVSAALARAHDVSAEQYSPERLRPRLHIMNPDVCEGFFADVAVLVEGISDKAALEAAAALEGVNLQERGISIIPCGSANNLDRPASIFKALGIPTYLIWDGDSTTPANINVTSRNLALQRLIGIPIESLEHYPSFVHSNGACFQDSLETTLRAELTEEVFVAALDDQRTRYGFDRHREVLKTPQCMTDILFMASIQDKRSRTLQRVIQSIAAMSDSVLRTQQGAEIDDTAA